MTKRLWAGLLVLVVLLGPVSGFWAKPAQAHTEDRLMLMAAWPWSDGGWNSATPPGSGQKPASSSTNLVRPKPQNLQQRPQKSFWSRLRVFFLNLRLLLGSK